MYQVLFMCILIGPKRKFLLKRQIGRNRRLRILREIRSEKLILTMSSHNANKVFESKVDQEALNSFH